MSALFLVCLVGGLVATALLAMLGGIGSHLHAMPAHTHLPGVGDGIHGQVPGGHAAVGSLPAHAHVLSHPAVHGQPAAGSHAGPAHVGDAGQSLATSAEPGWTALVLGWTLSWMSPLTLAAAALGFGGIGLIVNSFAPGLALAGAILGALVGAAAVRALLRAFLRAETPALQATAEGAIGQINAPIRADRLGEVLYTLEGLQRSAPARSVDGTPLPRGARVVIVRREEGVAWVAPLDPLPPIPDAIPPPAGLPAHDTAVGADLH